MANPKRGILKKDNSEKEISENDVSRIDRCEQVQF